MTSTQPDLLDASRRRLLAATTTAGLAHTLFPGALLALFSVEARAQTGSGKSPELPKITVAMVEAAEGIAGLHFTAEQRTIMLQNLNSQRDSVEEIRKLPLPNAVAPSLVQDPLLPAVKLDTVRMPPKLGPAPSVAQLSTSNEEALAFSTTRQLAVLLRARKITSADLTKLYLARLKRYDPTLHFVITLTEERALAQAAQADRELAAGKPRGPLHGIPWGAKDLLAVKGYKTTWGAGPYMDQTFDYDAEVVKRLDAAGAVLVAKLTLGALAQGDLWGPGKGTRTRNPWNPKQGSSGKLCRCGQRCRCRVCGLRHRYGNARLYQFAVDALRDDGPSTELRPCAAHRCHGAELVDG